MIKIPDSLGLSLMSDFTPKPPIGGLSNTLIFNKSPLGDLGVDLEKEAFETARFINSHLNAARASTKMSSSFVVVYTLGVILQPCTLAPSIGAQ